MRSNDLVFIFGVLVVVVLVFVAGCSGATLTPCQSKTYRLVESLSILN